MSNQLAIYGASPSKQTRFAPIYESFFSTGLYTQINPLRPVGTALNSRFYGGKNDKFLDGANVEISNRLTPVRRPGSSVYNSQTFPAIDSFYEFRLFDANNESIKVLADTASVVYDATGPNTKAVVLNKSAGAGQAYFQSVGNTLYIGDGVDQKEWIQSAQTWKPNTSFTSGSFIIDTNGNIEVPYGGLTLAVSEVQVVGNVLTLTFSPNNTNIPENLMFLVGIRFTLSGFVNATFLNGQTITVATVPQGNPASTSSVITASFTHANYGPSSDSGSATTGTGTTGGTQPTWSPTIGTWTVDGGQQWLNRGSNLQNWGIAAPTNAPTVTQSSLSPSVPNWMANTYYTTSFLIQDEAGFIQLVTTFGSTGASEPTWDETPGGTTADGSVIWTNQGTGTYASSTVYAEGAYIVQTDSLGNKYFFQALNAGTSGAAAPTFLAPLGSQTLDNGIIWINIGVWADWADVTSSTISGDFAVIPVQGGGSVILGAGNNTANGTNIALPTGYSTAQLISWNTPSVGFGGESSGVFQATTSGGILNASFQDRSNGFNVAASSNWAAAAWTSSAAVTVSTIGSFQYIAFTTALGDDLQICTGSLTNGSTVIIPSGFAAAQFQYIVGAASTVSTTNGMNVLQVCSLNGTLELALTYNDDDGDTWTGTANVFGVFWKIGGGVTSQTVTGGTAIVIPIRAGQSLGVVQANVADSANFGLPAGFGSNSVAATCAMASGTLNATHIAHGWNCFITGTTYTGQYVDGGGIYTQGNGNIFAIVSALSTTPISQSQEVLDSNSRVEKIIVSGLSGSTAPVWSTSEGASTTDNNAVWDNTGQGTGSGTLSWIWAYAYMNSVTGAVSTASPLSKPLTVNSGNYAFLTGQGSTDPQVDTIVIYRTVQGGSVLLEEDEIPNPPNGGTWQYVDENSDSELDVEIEAAIDHANDPPPVGIGEMTYHLDRIWGAVNNSVYFSGGPDTTTGNGNEAFPPANVFVFPDKVSRLYPTSQGLFVFTVSDIYQIAGTTTVSFFSVPFVIGVGLPSYNAFDVNGSTPYFFTSDSQVVSFDMSAGISEVGFNIGDQFLKSNWNPSTARVTYHIAGSPDKGLYVSDDQSGWFRMYPTPSPETGVTWTPFASIVNGCSAVQSVETQPGIHSLLIGPKTSGPILKRDSSVYTDNGNSYDAFFLFGSIVLAQPGQIAELVFLTTDSMPVGNRPSISIQLDEISPFSAGMFESLPNYVQDPTELVPSTSLFSDRYYISQTQQPALCRSVQIRFDWGNDSVQNELLTLTLFGGFAAELS